MNTLHRPNTAEILAGLEPMGSIDSPSATDRYQVVLRENARGLHLMQGLVVVEVTGVSIEGDIVRQHVLGQVREISLRNQHHEIPLFQAQLRVRGSVPGLSGLADHVTAMVVPVDAVNLDATGAVLAKVGAGTVIPSTGTDVHIADNEAVGRFIARDTPGLLNVGHLIAQTHMPLKLPHHADGEHGSGEALHIGVFGKSGSGKTVLTAQLICGWARHREMGALILDHDGDLSAMCIGEHFDLRRGLVAAGRDLERDVIVIDHDRLRLDAPRDLARALAMDGFIRQLGIGAGEKTNACERKLFEVIKDLLGERDAGFAALGYEDAIDDICEAFAETYATGTTGNARSKREADLKALARDGARNERELRRIWTRVQGYASRPHPIADIVEQALFEGKFVFIRRADADGAFDDMVLKRIVRTTLDIAKVSYLLERGGEASEIHGRYGYLRGRFSRYRGRHVNAVAVIDEAHTIAGEDDARQDDTVAAELAVAIRHTRKYRLAFCVATQEIGALAQHIFRGLHTYVFGYGLKSSSEQDRVREILADPSAYKLYEGFPDPKASKVYKFAVQGSALPIANGAAQFITAYRTQDDFLAANAELGFTDREVPAGVTAGTGPHVDMPPVEGLEGFGI